jgi:hypothetical protein
MLKRSAIILGLTLLAFPALAQVVPPRPSLPPGAVVTPGTAETSRTAETPKTAATLKTAATPRGICREIKQGLRVVRVVCS